MKVAIKGKEVPVIVMRRSGECSAFRAHTQPIQRLRRPYILLQIDNETYPLPLIGQPLALPLGDALRHNQCIFSRLKLKREGHNLTDR
jgi:hypothetical protein